MTIYKCANPTRHPTLHGLDRHHHPAKAWRAKLELDPGVDQSWWRIVEMCATDHSEIHHLLNAYVHAAGAPPLSVRRTFSKFVQALAAEAWERRPSDKPPYTDV